MHVYRNILEHKTYDVIPVNEFTLKNLSSQLHWIMKIPQNMNKLFYDNFLHTAPQGDKKISGLRYNHNIYCHS